MDSLSSILMGLQVACQPLNLFFCFVGVLIGTLIGVLPGIGPVATLSILLPITFRVPPVAAIIMLAGVYYGAMYGGSTTSILVNIPGEASSVVTCLDGYQMARRGKAGPALGIAAFASFIAGTLGIVGLMLVAPPLSQIALRFSPVEYCSLVILGLTLLVFLSHGPMWKSLLMAAVGIFLGCVGLDTMAGFERFSFGIVELADGLGIAPVAMGLFGISEVLLNIEHSMEGRPIFKTKIQNLLPSLRDWADSIYPILRGTALGFFLGILPGGGAVLSSFLSYAVEKKVSQYPERFGQGAIEGVAGPEAANNSASAGAFIPLLTLGIPSNAVTAILLGAMIVFGMQPGPLLIQKNPDLFWGTIMSMYVGNIMLLVLNLPLIGIWVKILKVPYSVLFPLILLFCLIGAYSINNLSFDLYVMILFGVIGWIMRRFGYEGAPLILAYVLGPLLENALRQSLLISKGSFLIFVSHPISAVALGFAFLLLLSNVSPYYKRQRAKYEEFKE
jgi:putative tricarboxylic transport membrane protein